MLFLMKEAEMSKDTVNESYNLLARAVQDDAELVREASGAAGLGVLREDAVELVATLGSRVALALDYSDAGLEGLEGARTTEVAIQNLRAAVAVLKNFVANPGLATWPTRWWP
jgi:hypothetical protein